MRSRFSLLSLIFVVSVLALPHLVHAGGVPFFGPVIPSADATCAGGWGLLVTVINNIISLMLTLVIVFIAPLMIAYSGFLYVVNPVNPAGKEKAKTYLTNTILGVVIALSAWFIVDAVMAVLYNNITTGAPGIWGTWTSLVSPGSGNECLLDSSVIKGQTPTPKSQSFLVSSPTP